MNHPKVTTITSTLVPLANENVDTDQIIPARFLKATTREGFGENLFRDWRYNADGSPKADFMLNNPNYSGCVLVTGKNFGCGSSREHAAWALYDYGFRAVLSSFFADIFKGNALNNSLLPIVLPEDVIQKILFAVQKNPKLEIQIDLPEQMVRVHQLGIAESFEINAYKKECLLNGYDDIDYLISQKQKIEEFESKRENAY
jgi:3-isopropylmalate/(R)-2-methylmalate dehydratase small subunit